jgi:hypothetical protein
LCRSFRASRSAGLISIRQRGRTPPGAAPSPQRPCAHPLGPQARGVPRRKLEEAHTLFTRSASTRADGAFERHFRRFVAWPSHRRSSIRPEPPVKGRVSPTKENLMPRRQNQDPYAPPPMHHDRSGAVVRFAIIAALLGAAAWGYMTFAGQEQTALAPEPLQEEQMADAAGYAPAPETFAETQPAPQPPAARAPVVRRTQPAPAPVEPAPPPPVAAEPTTPAPIPPVDMPPSG